MVNCFGKAHARVFSMTLRCHQRTTAKTAIGGFFSLFHIQTQPPVSSKPAATQLERQLAEDTVLLQLGPVSLSNTPAPPATSNSFSVTRAPTRANPLQFKSRSHQRESEKAHGKRQLGTLETCAHRRQGRLIRLLGFPHRRQQALNTATSCGLRTLFGSRTATGPGLVAVYLAAAGLIECVGETARGERESERDQCLNASELCKNTRQSPPVANERPQPELTQNRRGKGQASDERLEASDPLSIYTMPRAPVKASTVAVSGQQTATATASQAPQQQTVSRLQQLKEEAEMQQLQLQQLQQQQQHQQQYQLHQQAHMLQQQAQLQQQQSLQYPQTLGTASGTLGQSATANNLVTAAVQAATNAASAANAAATAGGASAGGGYAFPRNSPEFACENVGERVKGKRRKYCPHEVTALVLGVQRYADDSCPWSSILRDPHLGHLFHGRSGVDLKDKWRTLIKTRPELAAYTENRKNHRKYRPFSATEERALLEGVKKYNGQRNVWSLILVDKELGPQFNDRSNVQLKDKFRTMRRAGATTSLLINGGGTASRRTSAESTPTSESSVVTGTTTTATAATTSRTVTPTSTAALTAAVSAAVNGTSRAQSAVTSASQQAAALLVQNSNAASAMFADPNLYLAGSFSIPSHISQGMSMQQMTTTQSRQQSVQAQAQAHAQAQAQAQAHAQAQAIANAQARAAQVQLEAQMQMRAHGGQQQVNIKQQYQTVSAHGGAFSAGIPGYQLVGNQIIPQQSLYYSMAQNNQNQQQAHLQQQQQLQQQIQQRHLQQQQQQLAAAIAAASNSSQQQQKSQSAGSSQPSGTSRGASDSRGRGASAQSDKHNDGNSVSLGGAASSPVDDLLMQGGSGSASARANTSSTVEHSTRSI